MNAFSLDGSLTAATSKALQDTDCTLDYIAIPGKGKIHECSKYGACLKRRHVYEAGWPSGRSASWPKLISADVYYSGRSRKVQTLINRPPYLTLIDKNFNFIVLSILFIR